jgi:uncharacterized protein
MAGLDTRRVVATPAILGLITELKERYGALLFHQSGGCCDGSSPMCYPAAEFPPSDTDVWLGEIHCVPFYIGGRQFEYWRHTQLIIDVDFLTSVHGAIRPRHYRSGVMMKLELSRPSGWLESQEAGKPC